MEGISVDLKILNTFIQVADSGSFTRAGEVLGYSQPTVSVQIRQLEQELGSKLFDRIGHTVRLTERGHEVLLYAQRICHICQEMATQNENSSGVRGKVRLGMPDSLCAVLLERGFGGFREKYPNISIYIATAGTNELFRLLDHNEVDLVCTMDSHIYNTNYVVVNEDKVGVHFVVSAENHLAGQEKLTVQDILEHPLLLTEKGMSYRRILDEWLARDGIELHPVLEISNTDAICTLVEQGIGLSFLPDYVTERAVAQGKIVRLEMDRFAPDLWKQLLYHRDKWLSPQMEAVIEYLSGILLD